MLNGFSNQVKKGLAGIIAACLITLTTSPLLIQATVKPTITAAQHRVVPYRKAKAPEKMIPIQAKVEKSQVVSDGVQPIAQQKTENSEEKPVDVYLLARVIHAEARGEPFEGQVAIGAVLLNRLRDPRFPKTLQQIIFKQGEFCTVRDGQVWLPPNDESIRAAKLAVAGWDPTGGALYFYNPAKTTSKWIWSRPVTNHIGQHVFAA